MSSSDLFEEYKLAIEGKPLKRARVTAGIFGMAGIISILSLIYGFTKETEAATHEESGNRSR